MDTSYTEYSQEDMPNILIDFVMTNLVIAISLVVFIVFVILYYIARGK